MEAVRFHEILIIYQTTCRHITVDRTFLFALNLLTLSKLTATRLLGFLDPEDGGSTVQRNAKKLTPNYTVLTVLLGLLLHHPEDGHGTVLRNGGEFVPRLHGITCKTTGLINPDPKLIAGLRLRYAEGITICPYREPNPC
jgi:hypothetical protein